MITVVDDEFDWNSIDGLVMKLETLKAQHGNVKTFVRLYLSDDDEWVAGDVDAEYDPMQNGVVIY